jgi:hypothetical protein
MLLRRVFFAMMLIGLAGAVFSLSQLARENSAAQTKSELGSEPVVRTQEDEEARRRLDAPIESQQVDPRAVISHVVMPTTIRVGITPFVNCSSWVNAGQPITEVLEMDFKEYVKNVLPNEWPNAWPAESLRAGAVAAKMFAWWRVNLTTQFPTIRPEGVNVVDNTCDQVFWPNSKRPTTDAAIESTWRYRLSYNNLVQEIHYLSTDAFCDQYKELFGWPRCMAQYGTLDMANAGQTWQEMVQRYFAPMDIDLTSDFPPKINVVKNPKFTEALNFWSLNNATNPLTGGGGLTFHRATAASGTTRLRQDMPGQLSANSPLKLVIRIGNTSAVSKQFTARIMSMDGTQTGGVCTFSLPPNTPVLNHVVWGKNATAWNGLRVDITADSADSLAAYQIEKVRLDYRPNGDATSTPCVPPLPGKPIISAPVLNAIVGSPVNVALQPGKTNYRPGYSESFRIQVDDSADFSSPFFDNAATLSLSTVIPVNLSAGAWYVRAQQFDGIDRYSNWTAGVRFVVADVPSAPALIAPSGEIPAQGQAFIWQATVDAANYKLLVKHNGLTVGKVKATPAELACTATCSLPFSALPSPLTSGLVYSWKVKAINPTGKATSAPLIFTLVTTRDLPTP